MQTELFEQEEDRSEIWSVTEITQAIHKSLQNQFPVLWVRGEISNLRVQASGHRYFLLKDENCQLKAVFFRGDAVGSAYLPKEGDDCIAYGRNICLRTKRGISVTSSACFTRWAGQPPFAV